MAKPQLTLDKRFKNRVSARYEKYQFEGGVLDDVPYRTPKSKRKGLGTLRGGPVRKQSQNTKGKVSDVAKVMRKKTNFLQAPFAKPRSKDHRLFRNELFNLITKKGGRKSKAESLFRAIIRNPMLKKAYGRNADSTIKTKGFNRLLFDTGQLFRNIKAKMTIRGGW